ncbi:MAG TPA: NADH-quinone oxidoreductase subunit C, partial [Candidatus Krumholzibacterium sp.]|nr:NADH-quinone oxidoreductase subunit C [Candidatus Krumholzibacterium sp.]
IKTFAKKPYPAIDSISNVIPGAKWIEKDIHEMFEVDFKGHPDMTPLLRSQTRPVDFYPHKRENKDDHEMSRRKLDGDERFDEVWGRPYKGKNP